MKKHNPILLLAGSLALLGLISLGCAFSRPPEPTATLPPAATATSTNTATLAPTATATPQPTATATSTPTPEPSPTPLGYVRNSASGFSIIYPKGWKVVDQSSSRLSIADEYGGFLLTMSGIPNKEALKIDDAIKLVQAGMEKGTELIPNGGLEEIELADGVKATKAAMTMSGPSGKADFWLIYTHKSDRDYVIVLMGYVGELAKNDDILTPMLQSVTLFAQQPYDLPHDETISMLGNDPLGETLDPATAKGSAEGYAGLLYAGLVRLSPDLQVTPDLAESWKISGEGKVYTFTLRAGIKFADGKPITAEDVRQSWERALDPKTKSTTAKTYLGDILGAADRASGKASEISGLKVIDERTLEVTLDGAKPYFLSKLTYPVSYVIDPSKAKANDTEWMFHPNSSGTYQVKEYRKKEAIIFKRNPNYFKPAAVNYLLFTFEPGGSPRSLYEDGTLDILPVGVADLKEISQLDHPLNKELLSGPSMCTTFLQLNTNLAPTDDPLVRKALFLATDRKQWIERLTGGQSLLATGILPPVMPGYQADRKLPEFDPQAAKEALSQSKYAGQALTIVLSTSGYADSQDESVALLVDQWQKSLGVKVKVDLVDPDKFTETIHSKPGNVIVSGWCADYPDPENFLDILFHSNSNFNYANLNDPELDALLEKARTELDPAKRLSLYQQAETRVLEQFDVIPISNAMQGLLVKPRVKNYKLTPIGVKILPELTIEAEKK